MAFQNTAMHIDIWRFIASIAIGVELVNIDTYVSELAPHPIAGLDGWRWVAILGAIGAIPIWFIRLRLPESPRWLEQKGRHHAADAILSAPKAGHSPPHPSPRAGRE